ncbi:MAG TPA: alpha/beta hydrolase [Anaerolineaceae bacterium]
MQGQETLKKTQVNGTELHYIEQGEGDPLIFVHGSLGDYRAWALQIGPFSSRYHVIAYSRRYHYPNPWTGSGLDYTVDLHGGDLIGLIEALGLGPVHAVGNSFGAYTILDAAKRRPDLLRKLVIGEPPIVSWLKQVPGGQVYWDAFYQNTWKPATQAFQAGDLEQGVRLFIEGVSGAEGVFERLPEPVRQRMLDNAREMAAETASSEYFTGLTTAQVAQITNPMLLLRGERSPKMFHLIVDRIVECLPSARLFTIPAASHSLPSDNPPVYNQVAMDFLAQK